MTVFRFRPKHTNRISGKNLSWCILLTGIHFEYEIQFHNVRVKIALIVTLQPANTLADARAFSRPSHFLRKKALGTRLVGSVRDTRI